MKTKLAALIMGIGLSFAAQSESFYFNDYRSTSPVPADLPGQLQMTVGGDTSSVTFTFENIGSVTSSITDVYFEDLAPLSGATSWVITSSTGVAFDSPATPDKLSGYGDINWKTSFSFDSNAPVFENGVNNWTGSPAPLEWLMLTANGVSADALLASALRVGIHVQGIGMDGNSASFVTQVPEPETYTMLLAGLGLMAAVARRRTI